MSLQHCLAIPLHFFRNLISYHLRKWFSHVLSIQISNIPSIFLTLNKNLILWEIKKNHKKTTSFTHHQLYPAPCISTNIFTINELSLFPRPTSLWTGSCPFSPSQGCFPAIIPSFLHSQVSFLCCSHKYLSLSPWFFRGPWEKVSSFIHNFSIKFILSWTGQE